MRCAHTRVRAHREARAADGVLASRVSLRAGRARGSVAPPRARLPGVGHSLAVETRGGKACPTEADATARAQTEVAARSRAGRRHGQRAATRSRGVGAVTGVSFRREGTAFPQQTPDCSSGETIWGPVSASLPLRLEKRRGERGLRPGPRSAGRPRPGKPAHTPARGARPRALGPHPARWDAHPAASAREGRLLRSVPRWKGSPRSTCDGHTELRGDASVPETD